MQRLELKNKDENDKVRDEKGGRAVLKAAPWVISVVWWLPKRVSNNGTHPENAAPGGHLRHQPTQVEIAVSMPPNVQWMPRVRSRHRRPGSRGRTH